MFWRTEDGTRAIQVEGLDDIYFFDLRDDKKYGPFFTMLKQRGVTLMYQSQMNAYMCPDIGIDIAGTATMVAIDSLLAQVSEIEYSHNQDTIFESDIRTALTSLSQKLSEEGEVAFAAKYGTHTLFTAEKALALYKQRSSFLSEILSHVVWTNRNAANRMSRDGNVSSLLELYMSRSHAQILLLGFNKTVTPRAVPLIVRVTNDEDTLRNMQFTTYTSDLQHIFSSEEIIGLMLSNFDTRRAIALPRQI